MYRKQQMWLEHSRFVDMFYYLAFLAEGREQYKYIPTFLFLQFFIYMYG